MKKKNLSLLSLTFCLFIFTAHAATKKSCKDLMVFKSENAPAAKSVKIDPTYFVLQEKVEAPRIHAGTRKKVGTFKLPLSDANVKKLYHFLFEKRIVQTYVHLESNVCLSAKEVTKNNFIRLHFKGSHLYVTSEAVRESLAFHLDVDMRNGDVFIEGE